MPKAKKRGNMKAPEAMKTMKAMKSMKAGKFMKAMKIKMKKAMKAPMAAKPADEYSWQSDVSISSEELRQLSREMELLELKHESEAKEAEERRKTEIARMICHDRPAEPVRAGDTEP